MKRALYAVVTALLLCGCQSSSPASTTAIPGVGAAGGACLAEADALSKINAAANADDVSAALSKANSLASDAASNDVRWSHFAEDVNAANGSGGSSDSAALARVTTVCDQLSRDPSLYLTAQPDPQ